MLGLMLRIRRRNHLAFQLYSKGMNLTELPPEGTSIKGSHFIPATPSKSFHAATLQQFQTNQNHRKESQSLNNRYNEDFHHCHLYRSRGRRLGCASEYLRDPLERHSFSCGILTASPATAPLVKDADSAFGPGYLFASAPNSEVRKEKAYSRYPYEDLVTSSDLCA